jgi:hypothetical protein
LWDKIIERPEDAWIKETNEFVKYALIDQGQELRYLSILSLRNFNVVEHSFSETRIFLFD